MPNITESFEWMSPQWKIVDAGKNTVRIKGVALRGNAISRNNRKYVTDELRKSARTWVGKPITINHDGKRVAGNLTWMEYSDESDALEYLGDVNKQPYVDMLRSKSAEIRGVSIEAQYLHNQCPRCGQRFYTDEEFHDHMHNVEFIKTDPTKEPHGIIGTALSLVLSPQEPGFTGTTVQVVETVQNGWEKLFETLEKIEEEKRKMKEELSGKATLTEEKRIPWDQKPATATKTDVSIPVPVETPKVEVPPIKEELKIAEPGNCSPELKACVDDVMAQGHDEGSAIAICKARMGETVKLTVRESANLSKLEFIPEGSIYENFDACVAAGNSRKECAGIFDAIEARNNANKRFVEGCNFMIDVLNSPIVVAIPKETIHDNLATKESVSKLSETMKTLVKEMPKDDLSWKEMIAAIPKDDLGWKEIKMPEIPKIDESWKERLGQLEESVKKQKTDFDVLLESADKSVKEYFAQIKKEREADATKIKELEVKLKEAEERKLKETAELETRVDNVEDKIKGQFKGKAVNPNKEPEQYAVDPNRKRQ